MDLAKVEINLVMTAPSRVFAWRLWTIAPLRGRQQQLYRMAKGALKRRELSRAKRYIDELEQTPGYLARPWVNRLSVRLQFLDLRIRRYDSLEQVLRDFNPDSPEFVAARAWFRTGARRVLISPLGAAPL